MMETKLQQQEAKKPADKSGLISKAGKAVIRKGLLIAFGASIVLPACKSHKLCEAYSNSTIRKNSSSTHKVSAGVSRRSHDMGNV